MFFQSCVICSSEVSDFACGIRGIPSTAVQYIMACGMSVVSSSQCFFKAVSYVLQKFQISHVYAADVAYISKGTTSLVYESNISQTRRVCMTTNRSGRSICYQTFPYLMDFKCNGMVTPGPSSKLELERLGTRLINNLLIHVMVLCCPVEGHARIFGASRYRRIEL